MAAHRYWRVRIVPRSSSSGCEVAEIEMRESIGGPNVVSGGTAIAWSSVEGYPASHAFDNDLDTSWRSATSPIMAVGYDFGAGNEKDIYELVLKIGATTSVRDPLMLWLEWSDDDITWTELLSEGTIPAWTALEVRTWNADPSDAEVRGSLIEFHGAGISDAQLYGSWLEVHSTLTANPPAWISGSSIQVHCSVAQAPIEVFPYSVAGTVIETLSWLTDVLKNYDGTDQRIALRPRPRRSLTYNLSLVNDAERKRIYDMYRYSATRIVYAPGYHEQAFLKSKVLAGADLLPCNVERLAVRDGLAILLQQQNGIQEIYRAQKHTADSIKSNRPMTQDMARGTQIVPLWPARIRGLSTMSMNSISGQSEITLDIQEYRPSEAWPDRPVSLTEFETYPILDKRPTSLNAEDSFDAGIELIDYETGLQLFKTAWDEVYVASSRQYLCNRIFDYEDMQWWRTFFDYCCGAQRPFLVPTWRHDQVAASPLSQTNITFEGYSYLDFYASSLIYSRIEIETEDGSVYHASIASATPSGDNTVVTFNSSLPSGASGAIVTRVSYLLLSRLGNDEVSLMHEDTITTINLSLRTVKQ